MDQTVQSRTPAPADDGTSPGISLIDVAVAVVAAWKLVVLGALLAGLLAFGIATLLPETYEASALLRLTRNEANALQLDTLADQFYRTANDLPPSAPVTPEALDGFLATTTAKDIEGGLVQLSVRAPTRARTESVLATAIRLLRARYPEGSEVAVANRREIAVYDAALTDLRPAVEALRTKLGASPAQDAASPPLGVYGDVLRALTEFHKLNVARSIAEARLKPFEGDLVARGARVQHLRYRAVPVGLAAGLLAAIALINVVILREMLRNSGPRTREALGRLRAAFRKSKTTAA